MLIVTCSVTGCVVIIKFGHRGMVVVSSFGHGHVFIITLVRGMFLLDYSFMGRYVFNFRNDRNRGPEGPGRLRVACCQFEYHCWSWMYVFTPGLWS